MLDTSPPSARALDQSTGRERHSLKNIQKTVSEELDEFDRYFREAMRTDVRLLNAITRYVLRQKGKRIRPTLVLLTARAFGSVNKTSYRAAALVELMHTATLVHDDVVDEAEKRRGVFSINAKWKNKIAVLLGDFLLSRGLLLSLENNDYQLLHLLSDAVQRMSEGELLQLEKSRKLDIDEETYFRVIADKTGSLIAACTACGTYSAGADEQMVDHMKTFGEKLGLAFQIRDDLFDFNAVDSGKPMGLDLQDKKMTLPLIHSLREAGWFERRRIMKIVRKKKKSRGDLKRVMDFVKERGGIRYARKLMEEHAGEALALLDDLPPTEAREALADLVLFTIQRSR